MAARRKRGIRPAVLATAVAWVAMTAPAAGDLHLGPGRTLRDGAEALDVGIYSVPVFHDWTGDGAADLIVGQCTEGKVRLYPNVGTPAAPAFDGWSYMQADADDLTVGGTGCMGAFPRVVDWNADGRDDLLVGDAFGSVQVFIDGGAGGSPYLFGGEYLQVGPAGAKVDVDVGDRAAPALVDWNADGAKDLLIGAADGYLTLLVNEGADGDPDFLVASRVPDSLADGDLVVPGLRSSPFLADLTDDGLPDLLVGNTDGRLLLYTNVGTAGAPAFGAYAYVEAAGVPLDLPGDARSRPFVCDWTGDGRHDVLLGAADGMVYLYEGVPEPATLALVAMGVGALLTSRRRRCG